MSAFGNHICGCYYTTSPYALRVYLPQVQLESHTTITPLYFTTKLSQTFQNTSADILPETRYSFPLYDGVVVTAFTCTIGDKVIKGHVEQKEQARKTFDAAVKKGKSAGLLESLPLGVFGITLGNIPINASIRIDIVYGGELKHDAQIDGLRYNLPTSIAPRYGSYPGQLLEMNTAVLKSMNITVDIDMQGSTIRKVQCPSDHPIALSIGTLSTAPEPTSDMSKASVSLTHNTTELGSDFVLQVLIDDIGSPKAIIEKHALPNRQALMVTFVPRFNLKPIRPEIIFIADQSGSMQGTKNTALVAALKTFLKSLPSGFRFNICAFGSRHKFLWEKSVPYNQENFTQALNFVQGFTANYGGTELLRPVMAAFESHLVDMPLELVVLTDGEIIAESQLFDYVNSQINNEKVDARCFVLGVGRDVSHTLVEGFARAGNGVAQFITDNEVMDSKVVRMLKAALYPHVKDYRLEVAYDEVDDFEMVESETSTQTAASPTDPQGVPISLFDKAADLSGTPNEGTDRYAHLPVVAVPKLIQAPHVIPPLLPFNRTTVYLLLGDSSHTPKSVTLHGSCPEGPLRLDIHVKRIDDPNHTINTLSAKRAAQELEEGRGWLLDAREGTEPIKDKYSSRFDELVEREVVRLGTDYQVANKWCSFVAVEQREKGKTGENSSVDSSSVTLRDGRSDSGSCEAEQSDEDMGANMSASGPSRKAKKRQKLSALASFRQSAMPRLQASPGQFSGVLIPDNYQTGGGGGRGRATFGVTGGGRGGGRGGGLGYSARRCRQAVPQLMDEDCETFRDLGEDDGEWGSDEPAELSAPEGPTIPTNNVLATVRALVDLQSFDGHWEWTNTLSTFFDSHVISEAKSVRSAEDQLLATVMVLAWLKTSASEYHDLWEMVAEKASDWLEGQSEDSELLMSKAMSALTGGV
ncbi:hypothetical protein D6C86_02936 [Aureobasidium pullulans]|uniref:VIT-domain-containing protein n=1 Tax=Aureobasidium pullulans TaxID=5580 RepID=A0A4S9URH4_AURPU|nr:hypothetical protein D6C94_01246 [Aureobasidium pullulans]THZ41449.1 hypothetical protein D6C87_05703 [Aureobasidium pullulans]THZ63968.1 hypothetical protein D6C86_02936 [Aureobasidium pullulans]THZ67145.1 hypothetical protein D6C88_08169 [Aureobasidium pullulans]